MPKEKGEAYPYKQDGKHIESDEIKCAICNSKGYEKGRLNTKSKERTSKKKQGGQAC